jgi:hypothetical protein
VLAKHPEPRVDAAKDDLVDFGEVAARRAFVVFEVRAHVKKPILIFDAHFIVKLFQL